MFPAFDVTVVDAASDDHTVSAAEARGWHVVSCSQRTNRVDNWEFAVNHFIRSQADWCKWLFTGDHLCPHAHEMVEKAIKGAPEAKLIIFEYDIVVGEKRSRWKVFLTYANDITAANILFDC